MTVITEGFERVIVVRHYSLDKTRGPNYGCSNKQVVTLLRLLCPMVSWRGEPWAVSRLPLVKVSCWVGATACSTQVGIVAVFVLALASPGLCI